MGNERTEVIHQERAHRRFGKENTGPAEYLSRLAVQRDSIVEQEQMRLAHDRSRLGIQSSLNKDPSFRLRMNASYTHNSLSERSNMMTTVEKFRHMRQQQQKQQQQLLLATHLPIQGRQIFHRISATSDGKLTQNMNNNKMAASGNGISDICSSSMALLEAERITKEERIPSKKATKEPENFPEHLLPRQYYQESNITSLHKVRPKITDTVRQTVGLPPAHDNLSVISSQASVYYLPLISHDNSNGNWQPGGSTLEGESPYYNTTNSAQSRGISTRRKAHRSPDRSADYISSHEDMLDRHIHEYIHKGKIDTSRHTRTSANLPPIIEHQSLEVVCSKCKAIEKKQQADRLISKSADDFRDNRSTFSLKSTTSNNVTSRDVDYTKRNRTVTNELFPRKILKKTNVYNTEDEFGEYSEDLIVTSLPAISQSQTNGQRYGGGCIKPFIGYQRPRNGLKLNTNLDDKVERSPETSSLELCADTVIKGSRKINIIIDIPDIQPRSTTPDIDRELSSITPDVDFPDDKEPEMITTAKLVKQTRTLANVKIRD